MDLLKRIKNSKNNVDIFKSFQKCFANADGERILNYLTQLTLERVLPSNASNDELRHLEGQRFIVKLILNHSLK
jgi:hypothetical protein